MGGRAATLYAGRGGAVTVTRPEDPPEKAFETDGRPLAGMEVRVVDGFDEYPFRIAQIVDFEHPEHRCPIGV